MEWITLSLSKYVARLSYNVPVPEILSVRNAVLFQKV